MKNVSLCIVCEVIRKVTAYQKCRFVDGMLSFGLVKARNQGDVVCSA